MLIAIGTKDPASREQLVAMARVWTGSFTVTYDPNVLGVTGSLDAENEVGTLETLKAHRREVVDPAIASHKGRIVWHFDPPVGNGRRNNSG
jgi:hypothetical protein